MDVEIAMTVSFSLRRAMIKRMTWHWMRYRYMGLGIFLGFFLALVAVDVARRGWQSLPGFLSAFWFVGVAPAALILVSLLVYWFQVRGARRTTERLGEFETRLRISDEGIGSESPYESGSLTWRFLSLLLRGSSVWVLFFKDSVDLGGIRMVGLPADALAPEVREFIEAKVREAGGKVT